ncbi:MULTISPECIES: replicative DNA helicase [Caldanaerobacter]|uniref:Replicative DNA helicase n=4 Tax=Caldanaerobacter subterraneus TaxID=911092 RepID=Q8R6M8_CALS4|nr:MULTISPECIES: replicative DNA helicase [Caldanaerobacter]AAM25878.1 Replicative DNA helicase [Caldanaerobacter subterraneus subsp. tengcongensis MB4]ERM91625.1 DNA helicase [Caldanaerobacter subterraneus subsp. yonseiensis KB-1]MCS3917237.1 replicative DNA helicase [Caldanaerobacter subterraneus subsp. tengcongensis MB4]MDI3519601.1 replicative helicase [Caldanaerobacter sp.]TCO64218.1 primary replicative DNA helicase [Caldanaerobacter subterraneus]
MDRTRIPPQNIEAEQSVLGSMLLSREAIIEVSEILRAEDFYKESHKKLFDVIMEMFEKDIPVDLVTVVDELRKRDMLEVVGGIEYLASLTSSVITTANVSYYAKLIKEKATLRRLIEASSEIMELSYQEDDVETVLDIAEQKIFDIAQGRNTTTFSSMKDILMDTFYKIEELYKNKGKLTGIPSGFPDLDAKTAGFQPSDFILIAARPSMGKTSFALNIAQNAALLTGLPVAIFSLEMSKEQLVTRLICSTANIDSQKLRTGNLDEEDWMKLAAAMTPLSKAPIYIDDTPGVTVMDIRAKARRLKLEKGLGLVMIDYLQLMQGRGRAENRQQEISEISRSLKSLARELNVPVITLSQLSRAPETRSDHRPVLSDLRESGAIEQDADIVMFLYRDDYYHKDSEKKNIAEVIIAKHRNGPTGVVELLWLAQYTKFVSLDKYRTEEG